MRTLFVAFVFVALAFAQEAEVPAEVPAETGSFQCTPLDVEPTVNLDLEEFAGEESVVLYEIGASDAVKQYLEKGCTCARTEFNYMRIGRRESLLVNSLCKLEERDAEARASGALIPVQDVSFEGIADSIPKDEDNTGKFAFIVVDIEDPRLPQEIQDEWSQLREARLKSLFATLPSKATPEEAEPKKEEQQPAKAPKEQSSKPITRLRMRVRQAEETVPPAEDVPAAEAEKVKGEQAKITVGPLAEFLPSSGEGASPIQVSLLDYDQETKTMILQGGCKEFIWILSQDTNVDDEKWQKIVAKLNELNVDVASLKIERVEVPDTCMEKKAESAPIAEPKKVKESKEGKK